MNTSFKVLTGFLIGAVTGAAVGILTAPDTGERTRKKLRKDAQRFADDFSDLALKKIEEAKTDLNHSIDDMVKKGKGQIDKMGKSVSSN